MIKRIIDISEGPNFLRLENAQIVLERSKQEVTRFPAEDVAMLLIDNPATTVTVPALLALQRSGAAVVFCDDQRLPCGILLPVCDNALHSARITAQATAPLPLKKRLWQQIVRRKIFMQARNLPDAHPARVRLNSLIDEVRSGDPSNIEAQAARVYWPAMFGAEFRRDREADGINSILNYGYMVFRAAIARAVVAAGLQPALGLHHSNRNNPFCLADDLLEVFRPRIDAEVFRLAQEGRTIISMNVKQRLLSLLHEEIGVAGQSGPLMVALHRIAASLVRIYQGEQKLLDLPAAQAAASSHFCNEGSEPRANLDENDARKP